MFCTDVWLWGAYWGEEFGKWGLQITLDFGPQYVIFICIHQLMGTMSIYPPMSRRQVGCMLMPILGVLMLDLVIEVVFLLVGY